MKRSLWQVGLAALCGVAMGSEAALAGVVRWENPPQVEMAQGSAAEEFLRLYEEGRQFFNQGTAEGYRQAILRFEQALALSVRVQATDGIAYASSFLGASHDRLSEREAALRYYQTALEAFREIGDRESQATVLSNIGGIYNALGNRNEALNYYSQALSILQEVGNRYGEAVTLNGIGLVYNALGNRSEALNYFNQALPIIREVGDRAGEANTLSNIGLVYDFLGNRSEALNYYNQALPIMREVGNRDGEAATLNRIGVVYHALGNRSEALNYFNQALPIRREVGDRAGEATTLVNIGAVYNALGNPSEALDYYNQALPILREVGNREGIATILSGIGEAFSAFEQYSEALNSYNLALEVLREVGNRDREAATLAGIGLVYNAMGNHNEALNYLNQALLITQEVRYRQGEAATLNNIGGVYNALGNPSEALNFYNQALPILREVGNRDGEALTLGNIAWTYRNQNDLPTALENIEAAIAIVEELRGEITSTDLRTSYFATVQDYYELQIDLLMQLHQQSPQEGYDLRAFNASERTRARTLIELLSEANLDITENVDPQLRQREQELRQQLRSIDAQRVADLQAVQNNDEIEAIVEAANRQTNAVLRELDTLAAQLRETNPAYAALQYPEPLTLPAVQQQVLDADTTLLQYSLGDERSYLWVVTPNGFQTYTLPGRAEIETVAEEFYGSLDRPGNIRPLQRKAEALSEMLLAPVIDQLNTSRLLIVPDGVLHQIPFSALATPNRDAYEPLLVNYELVSAPSSTVIATNREVMGNRPPAPNRLAVLADPVFTPDDPRVTGRAAPSPPPDLDLQRAFRDFDLRGVSRLPHSRTEGDLLLALADGGETSVFDFDATYAWVTSHQANRYQFVHFATHGFANEENPELSGLVLSLVDDDGNPQNGFLRLTDIFNLQLPAEMVVLSACQTGLGDNVRGEGMVGLTRGLMYAGAERTVLSLWNVSDEQTAELMVQFYRRIWEDNQTPVAALRQAQLEMWNAGKHPYYWAAFGVQGEWRE